MRSKFKEDLGVRAGKGKVEGEGKEKEKGEWK